MPSASYSFLDVVVLDQIRARFAAGEALVVLSSDLEQVIWANGPGADLLGYGDIEAALGASSRLGAAAKRQIAATRGFPAIGRDRPLLARLAIGVTSRAVPVLASGIALPDGEPAILLASAVETGTDGASRATSGFGEAGHFVALINARGGIEAATPGFDALGISAESLTGLLARTVENRIVKQMIAGANGSLPAGLARLTDDPALHLLLVVDERRSGAPMGENAVEAKSEPAIAPSAHPEAALPQATQSIETPLVDPADERNGAAGPDREAEPTEPEHDSWYFSSGEVDAAVLTEAEPEDFLDDDAIVRAEPVDEPPIVELHPIQAAPDIAEPVENVEVAAPAAYNQPAAPAIAPVAAKAAPPSLESVRPAIDRHLAPVRFVWRTDAQGKFSQISPEFVAAIGGETANIVGRRFEELAAAFGFDGNGEIAGLLDRRDTWSGRSVLWPVAGAGISIPVDLAALPVYGRDRDFQGFRGFGVARGGDAVVDRGASRLLAASTDDLSENAPKPAGLSQRDEATKAADPFRGETPALHIAPMPDRRSSDKVIRLAEHRQTANDKGLSTGERLAFQQIAERLKRESGATAAGQAEKETRAEAAAVAEPVRSDHAAESASPYDAAHVDAIAAASDATNEAAATASAEHPSEVSTDHLDPTPDGAEKNARPGMSLLDFAQWDRETEDTKDLAGAEENPESLTVTAAEAGGIAAPDAKGGADAAVAGEPAGGDSPDATTNDNGVPLAEPEQDNSTEPSSETAEAASTLPAGRASTHAADTAILEKLPVPVLVHSGDDLHYANDEFLTLTGYDSVEQLSVAGGIGVLFAEAYDDGNHPEHRDRQMRLLTTKGEEFPVDAFLQSVPWQGGKALLLVLRRVEDGRSGASGQSPLIAELEARVAEMRTIIDTATDGVVLMTGDGTIRSISRPAEALFSFDSDEVAGKAFESLFAIESQRAARDYLNGLSDNGVASVLNDGREVIGRESRGRFIPLFMTIGKLPNDSGYCAVVRDITQWKRAEEDLTQARAVAERSSSQKTDFLARVSHEIRTPLNAIIGFSELMVDERFGPVTNDRYRDYLRDINRSGNHVLDLVNDLLDISKIEAGQQEMDYEAVSLNDALAETVAMMQPQANRERVIIRSSFASKLPDVVADLRSVRQIALNILSNAVRYTQAGGQVIVSTAYEAAGDIVMRVRDTGIGMTQAEIEQAMKPFKQINSLKRARGDGTGLGLPLTKAMVEANRAKFVIHSTPGEGTLVEVTFPSTRVLAD